jgi:hypothetical protein
MVTLDTKPLPARALILREQGRVHWFSARHW